MLKHLETLTWSFVRDKKEVYCLAPYFEPSNTQNGEVYSIRQAAESGYEGVACLDDAARAVVLALNIYCQTNDQNALKNARKWLTFVEYMQMENGEFTNFILDTTGEKNLDGKTSYPGGAWWTIRALWALSTAYRELGDQHILKRISSCPLPDIEADPLPFKLKALFVIAISELILSGRSVPAILQITTFQEYCDHLEQWSDPYLLDAPGRLEVQMWGYHQLQAMVRAYKIFHNDKYLQAAIRTARNLAEPVIDGNFFYSYPNQKSQLCVYCLSPLAAGLAELYQVTGEKSYQMMFHKVVGWLYGENEALTSIYDPASGRCRDGLEGKSVSKNCGAESSIEAGFIELFQSQPIR